MLLMLQEEKKMEEENALNVSTDAEQIVVGEDKKPEGMSNRGALELAIQDLKTTEEKPKEEIEKVETKPEVSTPPSASQLIAPATWTKEEKEDFYASSPKAQEAALRLDTRINENRANLQREMEENRSLKALSESMNPYLRAIGVKESTPVAIQKALTMWREFEHGDPKQAAAAYLKAKGIEVPSELLDGANGENSVDPKISSLQTELDAVKLRLAQEDQAKSAAIAQQVWSGFESTKNAAGQLKYPDINESESGLALSRYIGSLVCGTTEFSKQFITLVQTRIPNCTPERLLEEAYKIGGGRVDDSVTPARSTDPQEHLKKSNRAASSIPGRGSQGSNGNGTTKRFGSFREAAAHALAEIREREGS